MREGVWVGVEAAEGEADPQRVGAAGIGGAPAGHLGDSPQSVANSVGVDEQGSCRGLERGHLLKVGGSGDEERGVMAKGEVDLLDELAAGTTIASQGSLGQQFVGTHRARGMLPSGSGLQPEQG